LNVAETGDNPFYLDPAFVSPYTGQTDKYDWDGVGKVLALFGFNYASDENTALRIENGDVTFALAFGMTKRFTSTYTGNGSSYGIDVLGGATVCGGTATASGGPADSGSKLLGIYVFDGAKLLIDTGKLIAKGDTQAIDIGDDGVNMGLPSA